MRISPTGPALRALRAIDLLDPCVEEGYGVSQITHCDHHGTVLAVVEAPRLNGPQYPAMGGIMRATLHRLLREATKQTTYVFAGPRCRVGCNPVSHDLMYLIPALGYGGTLACIRRGTRRAVRDRSHESVAELRVSSGVRAGRCRSAERAKPT
jgi:hypothetical protein